MRESINCLFVALMMVVLLVAGCTESEEPSPTPTPIPEMTLTLTPMVSPSPSPTPTSDGVAERGKLKLSVGQKRILYTC
jgi:predicted component of type VI protein secretion system